MEISAQIKPRFAPIMKMKVDIFNTDKKYNIIYADPPWRNPKSGTKARSNEKYYPSMGTYDIARLPIKGISADNAILFMWVVFPCLKDSFAVFDSIPRIRAAVRGV